MLDRVDRDIVAGLYAREPEYFTEIDGCYVLYHVTNALNVEGILRDGLLAHEGYRSKKLSEGDAVYMFVSRVSADAGASNWLMDEIEEEHAVRYGTKDCRFARLEFHVTVGFVEAYGYYDLNIGFEVVFKCGVPGDFVKEIMYV